MHVFCGMEKLAYTVKKYLHDMFYYVFNYIVNVVGTRN